MANAFLSWYFECVATFSFNSQLLLFPIVRLFVTLFANVNVLVSCFGTTSVLALKNYSFRKSRVTDSLPLRTNDPNELVDKRIISFFGELFSSCLIFQLKCCIAAMSQIRRVIWSVIVSERGSLWKVNRLRNNRSLGILGNTFIPTYSSVRSSLINFRLS